MSETLVGRECVRCGYVSLEDVANQTEVSMDCPKCGDDLMEFEPASSDQVKPLVEGGRIIGAVFRHQHGARSLHYTQEPGEETVLAWEHEDDWVFTNAGFSASRVAPLHAESSYLTALGESVLELSGQLSQFPDGSDQVRPPITRALVVAEDPGDIPEGVYKDV